MKALTIGMLALVGAAFLVLTGSPGTAQASGTDSAVVTGSQVPSAPPVEIVEVPAPPVTPIPIAPSPWPIELPSDAPGSIDAINGPISGVPVYVDPIGVNPDPSAAGSVVERAGADILPVYEPN
jgi:hypothetical protein